MENYLNTKGLFGNIKQYKICAHYLEGQETYLYLEV